MKKRILLFTDWYDPGYKAGGPIRSCVNFAEYMKDDYDVYVFTGDRDLGDEIPYADIEADKWLNINNDLHLFYASPGYLNQKSILREIKEIMPDFIYLNSMFSKYFTVYPMMMKWQNRINSRVILAPRGMLRESALSFKPFKKRLFLQVLRILQIQKYISFHATDTVELNDIRRQFGNNSSITKIMEAPNFPGFQKEFTPPPAKEPGSLKMIFVGRIHPIKNLDLLLRCLQKVNANIELTVVGSIEDAAYKKQCDELIRHSPENITVRFEGDVPHHRLEEFLIAHHLFCLPTQGENFGHAIFEALAAGRPVLISNQTPWRGLLNARAGWDISLADSSSFVAAIEAFAAMNARELTEWCKGAWEYCHNYIEHSDIKEQYRQLFN